MLVFGSFSRNFLKSNKKGLKLETKTKHNKGNMRNSKTFDIDATAAISNRIFDFFILHQILNKPDAKFGQSMVQLKIYVKFINLYLLLNLSIEVENLKQRVSLS